MILTNILGKLIEFFKEVQQEIKKVNWPSREQTAKSTVIVLTFSVTVALFLGLFDFLFGLFLERFIL